MNAAGPDERATKTWQDQYQALLAGSAAASHSGGAAPDTGNANDPVRALLDQTSTAQGASEGSDTDPVANAHALLDAQANAAKDNGTELVFDPSRKVGQQVDFSQFDNQSLAAMVLNQDSSFSPDEVRAAKTELDQRDRANILSALNDSNGGDGSSALAMLQQYSSMTPEERSALGVSDSYANTLIQNYRSMQSIQNMFASSAPSAAGTSLTSYI